MEFLLALVGLLAMSIGGLLVVTGFTSAIAFAAGASVFVNGMVLWGLASIIRNTRESAQHLKYLADQKEAEIVQTRLPEEKREPRL